MKYSTGINYKDALLKGFIDDEYTANADAEVDELALTYGVSPAKIPTPCPAIVKNLAMAIAYIAAARDNSLMNAVTSETGAGKDSYELKRQYWQDEFTRLKGLLTAESFTGLSAQAQKATFPCSFSLVRS